jgi:hypothetical protein
VCLWSMQRKRRKTSSRPTDFLLQQPALYGFVVRRSLAGHMSDVTRAGWHVRHRAPPYGNEGGGQEIRPLLIRTSQGECATFKRSMDTRSRQPLMSTRKNSGDPSG